MKSKIYRMTLCLLVASSGVTAQAQTVQKVERSPIQQFLVKASKLQQINTSKQKATENDLLTGLDLFYFNDTEWIFGTRIDLTYEASKMKTMIVKSNEDDEWLDIEKRTNTYYDGLLRHELYEIIEDIGELLTPYEQYSYKYEDGTNPAIISEILYETWDENWIQETRDVYAVVDNKITEGITYHYSNDEWEKTGRLLVEERNDTTFITSSWFAGGLEVAFQREVYPALSLDELYEITFTSNVLQHIPFFLINSQIPDYYLQVWNGEEWENEQAQLTTYYTNPNQQPESKYINVNYWTDGNWVPRSSLIFYYNGKADPDSSVLNYFPVEIEVEDREWAVYAKEFYKYHENGLYDEVTSMIAPLEELEFAHKYKFEWNGVTTGVEDAEKPAVFRLNPAYPNPFNPTTNITYSLGKSSSVRIDVYDVLGRQVTTLVNGMLSAGENQVVFDASSLSSGIYIVKMEAEGFQQNQRITLMK